MRVLLTADTVGGVWSYAVELARTLARRGTDVIVATMGRARSPAQRADLDGVAGVDVRESAYRLEWMPEPWHDVGRAGEWLLELEAETRPDVVHLSQYAFGALPWRSPAVVVAHSCVCSWWRAVHGERAPAEWDRYRAAVRAGLDGAAALVAPTAAMLDALVADHGAPPAGALTAVIPNGRSADGFSPRLKAPIVLTLGRVWDEAKNVAAVERAAASIPWPVYVGGDSARPGDDGMTSRGGHRLGTLSSADAARWLGLAAIYALPALYEPFGLSVLEAGLAGCALVLSDIPSLREVWDGAALFVSPRDDAALVAALRRLIGDAPRRARLGAAARRRAAAYGAERMALSYGALYRRIVGDRGTEAAGALACAS
jgi:glycosyltransferase involved in cell wall biosynthesis